MKFKTIGIMLAVVLTARLGVYHNGSTGLTETWYNRSMNRVVSTAQNKGIPWEYSLEHEDPEEGYEAMLEERCADCPLNRL